MDWLAFGAVVVATLSLDRLLFSSPGEHVPFREAAVRTSFFVLVGTLFSVYVWFSRGADAALTYLTAYLVEESLSIDNLFVFLVLFNYFRINEGRQQRILFWGILGAIVMRGLFILAGVALLTKFHWMTYLFGGILLVTGGRLLLRKEESVDPEDSLALRLARRALRTTREFHGDRFFVIQDGVRTATPMFLVLVVVELTDLLFAVDSVPAVLAISTDVFVVYTSNVMAILGLRALYFVLSGMLGRFHYLGIGLALILIFIGAKMVISGFFKFPVMVSLGAIVSVLCISVGASVLRPRTAGTPES